MIKNSYLVILILILGILKLCGIIGSWWWVFAPAWIPFATLIIIVIGVLIYSLIRDKIENGRRR